MSGLSCCVLSRVRRGPRRTALRFLGLRKDGEPVEAARPEPFVATQPVHRLFHRSSCQPHRHRTTDFGPVMRPAVSSTSRCFITAGSLIANGRASSPMETLPSCPSRARLSRRVGSTSAAKVRSRLDPLYFTIKKSISNSPGSVKTTRSIRRAAGLQRSNQPANLCRHHPQRAERPPPVAPPTQVLPRQHHRQHRR